MLKLYWKRFFGIISLTVVVSILLVFLFYPCLIKSCGTDADAYCSMEGFLQPVCKCHHERKYVEEMEKCYLCTKDKDCNRNSACFNYQCVENRFLFNCSKGNQKIHVIKRCDFEDDCEDGSDESHNCGKTFFFVKNVKQLNVNFIFSFWFYAAHLYIKHRFFYNL